VKPIRQTELTEVRKARLSTKFTPKFKIFGPISVKVEIAVEIERATKAVYRDGDCRPDDTHDIWDRIRAGEERNA
jgi:hypothetical protein